MGTFPPYSPRIKNPYPTSWQKVSDFDFVSHLYLARAKVGQVGGTGREAEYLVFAEYRSSCLVDGKP